MPLASNCGARKSSRFGSFQIDQRVTSPRDVEPLYRLASICAKSRIVFTFFGGWFAVWPPFVHFGAPEMFTITCIP